MGENRIPFLEGTYVREEIALDPRGGHVVCRAASSAGARESLQQASCFIQALQERQGLMAACLEEIAYHLGWITAEDVARIAEPMRKNDYGKYLLRMLEPEAVIR